MSRYLVAREDYVHGASGPLLAEWVKPGDRVFISDHNGHLNPVEVTGVVVVGDLASTRVFTHAGDVVGVADSRFVTKNGPRQVKQLSVEDRFESLIPGNMPYRGGGESPRARFVDLILSGGFARFPAITDSAAREAASALEEVGITPRLGSNSRWIHLSWEPAKARIPAQSWESAALLARQLTTWSLEPLYSRLAVSQTRERSCLLALQFAAGFDVQAGWLPKYAPADCHVEPLNAPQRVLVPVDQVNRSHDFKALQLDVTGDGFLAVNRFLMGTPQVER